VAAAQFSTPLSPPPSRRTTERIRTIELRGQHGLDVARIACDERPGPEQRVAPGIAELVEGLHHARGQPLGQRRSDRSELATEAERVEGLRAHRRVLAFAAVDEADLEDKNKGQFGFDYP